jgi:hypothetical protein
MENLLKNKLDLRKCIFIFKDKPWIEIISNFKKSII